MDRYYNKIKQMVDGGKSLSEVDSFIDNLEDNSTLTMSQLDALKAYAANIKDNK